MTELQVRPDFDAEAFVAMSECGFQSEEVLSHLGRLYVLWLDKVHAYKVDSADGGRLLAWLDAEVEDQVESSWAASAHRGYLEHALAVFLLMRVVGQLVPEVAAFGCAPVTPPCSALRRAAVDLGLSWPENNTLCRRYSVTTAMPWQGGCERCHLGKDCPRQRAQAVR